ncbi:conserved domain protein [delta proteobacterium NaphS2]|nr:conserved domain protein [delta proteobacterium NaphS2]
MWFHGGWVVGNLDTHDGPCRACVASVDYRLAPEHKFPVAVYDCLAATRWVAEKASSLDLMPAASLWGETAPAEGWPATG